MKKNWDDYFIKMYQLVASKSKDRSTKVGAVIVGPNNEIRSTGYNGFPRGIDDEPDARHERPVKYKWTEHAERNAIYNAARVGIPLDGCIIYQSWYPCSDCARAIIQAGINEVVIDGIDKENKEKYWNERWGEDIAVSKEMLKEAGIKIRIVMSEKDVEK